jgi:glycosyltransferase involved in cell wall biosynthesis
MKVAIMTNFHEFLPGFSLTGIVQDQVRMLLSYNHEVHLFVNTKYYAKGEAVAMPEDDFEKYGLDKNLLHVRQEVPFTHLKDYQTEADLTDDHRKTIEDTKKMLIKELADFDIAFTHDWIFQGWFLPYGKAVQQASNFLPDLRWMHWIHSVPTSFRDWWDIKRYGPNHKIIYPNMTNRLLVAEQFRGMIEDVRCIHHIKDIRQWMKFESDTCKFLKEYPMILQADVVKLYPASVDRLSAKRVHEVIEILANMKKAGLSICLIIAAQWATGRQQKENIDVYKREASAKGLDPGKDLIFTSDLDKKYEVGITKGMVRDLFMCSNLFIFPTREETFGLVLPEAALSGVLTICNKSLRMLGEISGGFGLFFDFGSFEHEFSAQEMTTYLRDISTIAIARMKENESLMAKTHMRQHYNWDFLYNREYYPIMQELKAK